MHVCLWLFPLRVGKEILSKGKYAELFSDNRSFSQEEDDYFTQLAEHAYEEFRNKAAECRGMEPDEMQALAQVSLQSFLFLFVLALFKFLLCTIDKTHWRACPFHRVSLALNPRQDLVPICS